MSAQWQQAGGAPPSWQHPGHPASYSHPHLQQPYQGAAAALSRQAPAQTCAPAAPALRAAAGDSRLRSVEELPLPFRTIFPFRFFNAIQNECWPAIYEHASNVVVAAPTGGGGCCACAFRLSMGAQVSNWQVELLEQACVDAISSPATRFAGKTVLLELAILRLLARHLAPGGAQFAHRPGHLKAVYLAPSRALVQVGQAGTKGNC